MNKHIEGLIAAPLTGFNEDESVNLKVIPRYAAMLHSNGVAGVFVNGTTGEGKFLTFDERIEIARTWVDSAPEGLLVIIHVGYTDRAESKALAIHAANIGADAIGEVGPAFTKPVFLEKIVEYTADTASSVPQMPYYYYHMPSVNNLNFPMIEFLTFANEVIPNLAGIKYTHDDITDYMQCIEFMGGKYDILFGRDELLVDGLKAGAFGAVGSTYNIIAPLYQKLIKVFHNNDMETAQQLQAISAETCRLIYETGNFGAGLKAVLKWIGLDMGGMRQPQINLSTKTISDLESSLQKLGLFNFLNKV